MKKVTLEQALNSGACYTDTQIKALLKLLTEET